MDKQTEDLIQKTYKAAFKDGMRAYAWMKDGVTYVGTCGTTLAEALDHPESHCTYMELLLIKELKKDERKKSVSA